MAAVRSSIVVAPATYALQTAMLPAPKPVSSRAPVIQYSCDGRRLKERQKDEIEVAAINIVKKNQQYQ